MVHEKRDAELSPVSPAQQSRETGLEEIGGGGADEEAAAAPETETGTGTGAGSPGRLSLDAEDRHKLVLRLRRIEGQVRGLQRMVEEGRYCPEILTQLAAVQASLKGAGAVLLQGHLRHCVTDAIRSHDPARAEAVYRELTHLFDKYSR